MFTQNLTRTYVSQILFRFLEYIFCQQILQRTAISTTSINVKPYKKNFQGSSIVLILMINRLKFSLTSRHFCIRHTVLINQDSYTRWTRWYGLQSQVKAFLSPFTGLGFSHCLRGNHLSILSIKLYSCLITNNLRIGRTIKVVKLPSNMDRWWFKFCLRPDLLINSVAEMIWLTSIVSWASYVTKIKNDMISRCSLNDRRPKNVMWNFNLSEFLTKFPNMKLDLITNFFKIDVLF